MVIKRKKGIIRIIEAFVAILIIAAFLLVVFYGKISSRNNDNGIVELERIILEKLSTDDKYREAILNVENDYSAASEANRTIIYNEIRTLLPREYNFTFNICDLDQICGLPNKRSYYTDKEIYSDEISVSATLTNFLPKKMRLFIWESEY